MGKNRNLSGSEVERAKFTGNSDSEFRKIHISQA